MPDVSICIAAYNAEDTIAQSVGSALAQTVPVAVIVADDGSTDGTADAAERAGAIVLRCEHRGRAPTFNEAWKAADTEWIYFLGADDWIDPDALEHYMPLRTEGAWMLYGDIGLHDTFGEPRGMTWAYRAMSREAMRAHFLNNGRSPVPSNASCLWRRAALETLEGFRMPICTDTEMLQRAIGHEGFEAVHVPGARYHYRWSPAKVRSRDKAEATVQILEQLGQNDPTIYIANWLAWNRCPAAEPYLAKARSLDAGTIDAFLNRLRLRGTPPRMAVVAQDEDGGAHFIRPIGVALSQAGVDVTTDVGHADLVWVEWCATAIRDLASAPKAATLFCRLHSYEAFSANPLAVDWERVDLLGFVSRKVEEIIFDRFNINVPTAFLPNGIDTDLWTIPEGKSYAKPRIAFLGHMSAKKGPGLLAQVILALAEHPAKPTFHLGGRMDDPRFELYLREMLAGVSGVSFDGPIEDPWTWLADKTFILSTSPFESFGQGIAEAVCRGALPLVHDWPGADEQWPEFKRFRTVAEAADLFDDYWCVNAMARSVLAEKARDAVVRQHSRAAQTAAIVPVVKAALSQPGPDVIIHPERRFLRQVDLDGWIAEKRRTHRRAPGIERVLVHMPPNGGFRYIQQNYALTLQALGYEVRIVPLGSTCWPAGDLLLTAFSDAFVDDLDPGAFDGEIVASAGAFRDCAEIVDGKRYSPPEGWHYWTPVDTMPEREDYPNLHHLPYAANPLEHRHAQTRKMVDVAFCGTYNPTKGPEIDQWIAPLLGRFTGYVRGVGWGEDIGALPQCQSGLFYGGARIAPNVHQERQRTGGRPMLNERTFVIPSCGGFEVVDKVSVLRRYFDEDEMLAAETPTEMRDLVAEMVKRPLLRRDMALRAHHRVLAEHTYFDRVEEVMSWLR